jgi:hypothetical protein
MRHLPVKLYHLPLKPVNLPFFPSQMRHIRLLCQARMRHFETLYAIFQFFIPYTPATDNLNSKHSTPNPPGIGGKNAGILRDEASG